MLIKNWKDSWKMLSVQAMVVVGLVASLEPVLPVISGYLPANWVAYAMPVIVVARLIKQSNLETNAVGDNYE